MASTAFKRLFRQPVFSWALYDWANSAFATTVMAGIFPIFYSSLSQDLSTRDAQFWFNVCLAVSSIAIAIAAPILGAIADAGGSRKIFLATFAMLGITMAAGLAWVQAGMWQMGLLIYGLGKIGFAGANIFYDAMLVDVAEEDDFDLVSGFGYALGYVGGGLLFLVNVLMITRPEFFGLENVSQAVSVSFISVAIWWALFTIPLIRNFPEQKRQHEKSAGQVISDGFVLLRETFAEMRQLKNVLVFLCAYWLYIDGVGSIIKMAVFFGSRVLSLPDNSLIIALLITQFVAFPAALFFGWLGSKIGPRNGIFIGLVVYVLAILYEWSMLETAADFYKLAVTIGLVQGGVQSLSRSLFARLIPRDKATEYFGFFNMVGKFATILGPTLMAMVPIVFSAASDRDVILVVIALFVAGGALLSRVENVRAKN